LDARKLWKVGSTFGPVKKLLEGAISYKAATTQNCNAHSCRPALLSHRLKPPRISGDHDNSTLREQPMWSGKQSAANLVCDLLIQSTKRIVEQDQWCLTSVLSLLSSWDCLKS